MKNLAIFALLSSMICAASAQQVEGQERVSALKHAADRLTSMEESIEEFRERLDDVEMEAELSKVKFGLDFNTSVHNFFIDGYNVLNDAPYGKSTEPNKWLMSLNLNMFAHINDYTKFTGRLAMTKAWGDMQLVNADPVHTLDSGRAVGGPTMYIERAYIDIFVNDWFALTIGRLPSTDGPGSNLRNGGVRMATYPALLVNILGDGVVFTFGSGNTIARTGYSKIYQQIVDSETRTFLDIFATDKRRNADAHLAFLQFETPFLPSEAGNSLFMISYAGVFNYTVTNPNEATAGMPNSTTNDSNIVRGDLHYVNLHLENYNLFDSGFNWFISASYYYGAKNKKVPTFTIPTVGTFDYNDNTGYAVHAGFRQDINQHFKFGYEFFYGSKYWYSLARANINDPLNFRHTRGMNHELYAIFQVDLYQFFRLGASYQDAKYKTYAINYLYNNALQKGDKITNVSLSYILRF